MLQDDGVAALEELIDQMLAGEALQEEWEQDPRDAVVPGQTVLDGDVAAASEAANLREELEAGQTAEANHASNGEAAGAITDWDGEMQAFVRSLEWGHFSWSWKRTAPSRRHGVIELTCPYHKLNQSSGCKKTVALQNRTREHVELVVLTLKHWANQALRFNRQRLHILPYKLDTSLTPSAAVVEAQKLVSPPVLPRTDVELDADDSGAQGHSQFPPPPVRNKSAQLNTQ